MEKNAPDLLQFFGDLSFVNEVQTPSHSRFLAKISPRKTVTMLNRFNTKNLAAYSFFS